MSPIGRGSVQEEGELHSPQQPQSSWASEEGDVDEGRGEGWEGGQPTDDGSGGVGHEEEAKGVLSAVHPQPQQQQQQQQPQLEALPEEEGTEGVDEGGGGEDEGLHSRQGEHSREEAAVQEQLAATHTSVSRSQEEETGGVQGEQLEGEESRAGVDSNSRLAQEGQGSERSTGTGQALLQGLELLQPDASSQCTLDGSGVESKAKTVSQKGGKGGKPKDRSAKGAAADTANQGSGVGSREEGGDEADTSARARDQGPQATEEVVVVPQLTPLQQLLEVCSQSVSAMGMWLFAVPDWCHA